MVICNFCPSGSAKKIEYTKLRNDITPNLYEFTPNLCEFRVNGSEILKFGVRVGLHNFYYYIKQIAL